LLPQQCTPPAVVTTHVFMPPAPSVAQPADEAVVHAGRGVPVGVAVAAAVGGADDVCVAVLLTAAATAGGTGDWGLSVREVNCDVAVGDDWTSAETIRMR
jgi:hypothetical protein